MAVNPVMKNGVMNLDAMMNDMYTTNDKDDELTRANREAFKGNLIQSVVDAGLAKEMADFQSGIAQSNMTHAADLEARNTAANMEAEFNYGMDSMAAQFEHQDNFANNQYDRDLGTLAATGEQERKNMAAKGDQDRLTTIVAGEQQQKLQA